MSNAASKTGVAERPRKGRVADDSGGASSGAAAALAKVVLCSDGVVRPAWAAHDALLLAYHDAEWGAAVRTEQGLFEALSLEVFQAGLSWSTVLRKRPAFRAAFADFDPEQVAAFDESDVARLVGDAGIIRNERKVRATLKNASATLELRKEGGLPRLVWSFEPSAPSRVVEGESLLFASRSPESVALAAALKERGFAFVGPTTMHAFLLAVGVLNPRALLRELTAGLEFPRPPLP